MQKKAVVLSLTLLLSAAGLAQVYRSRTLPNSLGLSTASDGTVDKNLMPQAAYDQINAAFVPVVQAKNRARQLLLEGRLTQAEGECRRAIALAPKLNGQPWADDEVLLLGDILLAQGRHQDALECYLRVKTSTTPEDPDNPRPNLRAALAYCRLGNFKMAKKYCPDAEIAKYLKAEIAQREDWPGTEDLRSLEATILLVKGLEASYSVQLGEALLHLKAASELAPENWLIARMMGDVLYDLKRYKEAVQHYKRALQYGSDKIGDTYDIRMRIEMHERQNTSSAHAQRQAAPSQSQQAPAAVPGMAGDGLAPYQEAKQQARRLFNEGKLKEAEAACRRAADLASQLKSGLSSDPASPRYRDEGTLLGDILLAQGRNGEALMWYLQASLRPGSFSPPPDLAHPPLNLNAALAFCRLRNFSMARAHAPDAAIAPGASPEQWAQWPGSGDIRALEASLLLTRANKEEAVNPRAALLYLKQAATLAPRNQLIAQATARQLDRLR